MQYQLSPHGGATHLWYHRQCMMNENEHQMMGMYEKHPNHRVVNNFGSV